MYSLEGIMHACISVCFTRALVGFQWGHWHKTFGQLWVFTKDRSVSNTIAMLNPHHTTGDYMRLYWEFWHSYYKFAYHRALTIRIIKSPMKSQGWGRWVHWYIYVGTLQWCTLTYCHIANHFIYGIQMMATSTASYGVCFI